MRLLSLLPQLPWLLCVPLLADAKPDRTPAPVAGDSRIRHIDYLPDRVTEVAVQRGTATRIVLAADEHILRDGAATGYAADCGKAELEWCMRADPGSNQVLVRPKAGALANNLELRTDKRDYSFRFHVLPDSATDGDRQRADSAPQPAYRLMFRYPVAATAAASPPRPSAEVMIRAARPIPRNWRYSMQIMPGGADIAPALVFDDGRFTYLQFPANRELPTLYTVNASGEEARVNFHMDPGDPGLLVVERIARRLILRLGAAVIGLWNEAYDSDGIGPVDGSSIDGVVRTIKRGEP
ncbi:type IV secretion system protein VirB9 [Duganella sp. SG902]|uniref:TrbG/VirB9 family P-type conjugative transfer protein n=1 Tax=Duganella sp. SG902 TaxID=2587016 RepID=UPI00159DEA78|nr:TrbG/VirB9 family P-type conjugative transfer protein [Duganella sp. SG902]NVM77461.1 type IV secretion system protein VirB9 [Duganella sp. SG902]